MYDLPYFALVGIVMPFEQDGQMKLVDIHVYQSVMYIQEFIIISHIYGSVYVPLHVFFYLSTLILEKSTLNSEKSNLNLENRH